MAIMLKYRYKKVSIIGIPKFTKNMEETNYY